MRKKGKQNQKYEKEKQPLYKNEFIKKNSNNKKNEKMISKKLNNCNFSVFPDFSFIFRF